MAESRSGKKQRPMRVAAVVVPMLGALTWVMFAVFAGPGPGSAAEARREGMERDDAAARQAFEAAYPVFMSPRCMNCHPAGDAPLQGDDSRPHFYRVQRGPDGNGLAAMRCSNCHQAANQPGLHAPPGAPHPAGDGAPPAAPRWHLPGPKTRMVFQGRTPGELCRQLRNRRQNGDLTPEKLILHVSTDPLVLWGWNPGEGRSTPPLTHDEFVRDVTEWVDKGCGCPE